MAETYNKREMEKKRLQKRLEKEQRKEERKASNKEKSFDDMIAYVDENGNISSTPPDMSKKKVIKESDIDLTSRNMGGAVVESGHLGIVKIYHGDKGYGFIKEDGTNEEYFFHYSSADFPVTQQMRISFELERGPKGMNAVRLRKVDTTPEVSKALPIPS